MEFEKYYVVANTREQFLNEVLSSRVYNDHPSKNSIDQIVSSLKSEGYNADYFGGRIFQEDNISQNIVFKSFRWSDSTKPESTVSSFVGDAQCKVCWFRPNGFINGK